MTEKALSPPPGDVNQEFGSKGSKGSKAGESGQEIEYFNIVAINNQFENNNMKSPSSAEIEVKPGSAA